RDADVMRAGPLSGVACVLRAAAGFVSRRAPLLYLCYALPMVIFLAFNVPPFQVADENAHFFRAEEISHGELIGFRFDKEWSGGKVDASIGRALESYTSMIFHGDVKLSGRADAQGRAVGWAGSLAPVPFPNTVNYGPLLYLPQAASIRIAKQMDLRIVEPLLAARLVNAVLACLLSFIALWLCRHGRTLMFTALLLPMTLFQYASVSQDAFVISGSLLAIGLASHVIAAGRP